MDEDLRSVLGQYFQQFGEQIQQTLGGQIQQLREDTDRQFRETRAETDRQFREMREETGRQFREMREETGRQFREMNQRLDRMDQRQDKLETDVREVFVVVEGLHGQIRLVAEGVDSLRVQMERNDKELSRRIDEVMTFTRQAYRDLDARKLDKTA